MNTVHSDTTQTRSQRRDGDVTRAHILEIAGQLFAERGFANTTSKLVCTQAQTNPAAVNYHFGSFGGLYLAALQEVHRRLLNLDYLTALADSALPARDKLTQFIESLLHDLLEQRCWHTRLWARELMTPSPYAADAIKNYALPKFGVINRLVAEVTGLALDAPSLQRCVLSVMSPCMVLLVVSHELDTPLTPILHQTSADLVEHIKLFMLAGLDAITQQQLNSQGS